MISSSRSFRIAAFLHTFIFDYLFCTFENKSLSSVNLSLDLHGVSIFWLDSDTSGTLSLYFAQTCLKLERPALEVHIAWCKTGIYNLSEKVSLMLDNPFIILFLCNLKHVSLYFIQNSMETTSSADPLQSKLWFFLYQIKLPL